MWCRSLRQQRCLLHTIPCLFCASFGFDDRRKLIPKAAVDQCAATHADATRGCCGFIKWCVTPRTQSFRSCERLRNTTLSKRVTNPTSATPTIPNTSIEVKWPRKNKTNERVVQAYRGRKELGTLRSANQGTQWAPWVETQTHPLHTRQSWLGFTGSKKFPFCWESNWLRFLIWLYTCESTRRPTRPSLYPFCWTWRGTLMWDGGPDSLTPAFTRRMYSEEDFGGT